MSNVFVFVSKKRERVSLNSTSASKNVFAAMLRKLKKNYMC